MDTSKRRDLILLAVFSASLFLPWLGARDLWNPNEPLYGQAVSEMAQRGEWLVPTVNGAVFDEKPILYFWMARVAGAVFGGVNELTLRLPTALAGIVSVLLLYVLARAYVSRRRAIIAGLSLATTFVVFWSARQVQMDLLLTACTLAAILGATRALDRLWSERAGWMLAGAAAGAGFLAKGPVGLICPVLVVVGWTLVGRRGRELLRPAWWPAVPVFLVVAAPWYLLLWARGESAFLQELLVRQNFLRFVEPWDHSAPWWYYLKYFWIDMAPWAWFVPLAWGLQAKDERERSMTRLSWSWILTIVVFFSLSASKRSPYILPVAPAVALLVAGVAERWLDGRLAGPRRWVAWSLHLVVAVGFVASAVALVVGAPWLDPPVPPVERALQAMVVFLALAGLLGLAGLVAARGGRSRAPATLLAAVVTVYLAACVTVLPAANAFKSHRALCESIRAHVREDRPLHGFHEWRWRASYSFYTRRPVPNIESLADLERYWSRDEQVFLIVERGRLEDARRVIGAVDPLTRRAVGSNVAYLFSNRPNVVPRM